MGSSVDAFWAQLKAQTAPSAQKALHAASNGLTKSPITSTSLPTAAAPVKKNADATKSDPSNTIDVVPADQLQQRLNKLVEAFKDPNHVARRKALHEVKTLLFNSDTSDLRYTEKEFSAVDETSLGKALLRRFDDQSQACRELAVSTFGQLLKALPGSILALLPYAVPVLEERVAWQQSGAKTPMESSEEARLSLTHVIGALVAGGGKALGAYLEEVAAMCGVLLEDPYHEVCEAVCGVIVSLDAALGMRLAPHAKQLIASLLPLTTHKRHRVRAAAVGALQRVMHQNGHEMILEMVAFRDPNVVPVAAFYGDDLKVNFAGKLATDPHPQVRLAWLRCVGDWMLALRERVDHEPRLMPYALSALDDEAPLVAGEAVALLEQLGEAYEKEHAKDVAEVVYYLPEEAHGVGWGQVLEAGKAAASSSSKALALPAPSADLSSSVRAASFVYAGALLAQQGQAQEGGQEQQQGAAVAGTSGRVETLMMGGRTLLVMPGPLTQRPRLGARLMVGHHLGRAVWPLCNEVTTAWQEEPRRRALTLLRTLLVVGEDAAHQHLHTLVPALVKAVQEPALRALACDCAAVLACFVPAGLLLSHLLPRAADESADVGSRCASLNLIAAVIRGSGARGDADGALGGVLAVIEGSDAFLRAEGTAARGAVAGVLRSMCAACGPGCVAERARLTWIALHLTSSLYTTSPDPISLPPSFSSSPSAPALTSHMSASTTSAATLSPAQQQAAAEAEATTAVMGLLPAIAEACGAASVDQLVAAERAALLAMCCPAEVAAVWLEAGVLGQLMLTQHAPQAPLLLWQGYGPHMALAAAGSSAGASSSKSATASPGEQGEQSPLWSPASLAAALATLQSQLQLLAAHSQAGVCVLACLSSSIEPLSALGAGSWSAGAAASTSTSSSSEGSVTAGEALVQLLAQVAGSCPTGRTLTLALRCIQQAVSSGMASAAALTPHLTPLVQTLVGQGLAAPSVACRLQACATITAVVAALNAAEAVLDADTLKCLAAGLVSKMADPSAAVQEAACAALGSGVVVAAKACDVHSSTEGDAGSSSSVVAWIKSQLGEGCKAAGADCPRAFNALLYRL